MKQDARAPEIVDLTDEKPLVGGDDQHQTPGLSE